MFDICSHGIGGNILGSRSYFGIGIYIDNGYIFIVNIIVEIENNAFNLDMRFYYTVFNFDLLISIS